jgi:protein phosphatase
VLELNIGGISNAGKKLENQDAFASMSPSTFEMESKGAVIAIADGVSSASHAAQASQLSVTQFISEYYATQDTWSTNKSAAKVLKSLNQWLFSQSHTNKEFSGSADYISPQWLTTFTAAIFKSNSLYVFHIGDTRLSRYRHNKIETLTRDHNQKHGGNRAVLTRALGADSHLEVDYYQSSVSVGDIYMLSCDGVHDVLSEEMLKTYLNELPEKPDRKTLECTSQKIIEHAVLAGSTDNVSCVLIYINAIPTRDLAEIQRDLYAKVIPPALQVGQKIDEYIVKKVFYASTRSHLYLVEHPDYKKTLVLKAPSLNFVDDPIYLQGFVREAWVGERIKHKNVMRIITPEQPSKFLYHVCQYIEGQPLGEWMHDNPHPNIADVRNIIRQVISALRAFQRLDLVHRDLKPDNIMIDQYGHVTLIDYGTVSVASLNESHLNLEESVPQGTLNYIAPETLLHMHADHQSDLFSLGVVCYEMLCGALPYKPMSSSSATVKDYPFWHYLSVNQHRKDLPLWLDLALEKAVSADPKLRYKAFSEFEADINKPNITALADYQRQPLIERYPVQFWQLVSLMLFILLILSLTL